VSRDSHRTHDLGAAVALDGDRTAESELVDTEKSAFMFRATNRKILVGAWVAVLVAVAAAGALSGVPLTVGVTVLWFAACVVPPAVMLVVWRGAPPPTMAEILYSVDRRD
jgi:hypothetical protein